MLVFMTVGLVGFMALGMPVALALCVTAGIGYLANVGPEVFSATSEAISQRMYYSLSNFLLLSIPFFILAAKLMNSAGITSRIFNFANIVVGWLPGGLGHANVLASLIFAGMSGTAVSDAVGLGQIELKAMADNGYDTKFSVGITAASSTIGPIFPPSVPMVIYSLISFSSFIISYASFTIPSHFLTNLCFFLKNFNYGNYVAPTAAEAIDACAAVALPILTPVILLIGIWCGFFTPSEAAVVAFTYALILSFFVYREMGLKHLMRVFNETAKETATIGLITCSAAFYGWVLARSGVTAQMGRMIMGVTTDPLAMLVVINIFLLIVGCFMEPVSAILVIGPILVNITRQLGIDPVHFGVIMVLNLMIGLLTPPFGVVLFVMQKVSGLSFVDVIKGTVPFMIPLLLVLALITVFPRIILWLPGLIM